MGRKYDEEAKAKKKAYYEANKEAIKERLKKYKNSDKFKKAMAMYRNRADYKDRIKGYNEKRKEYIKQYKEKHREELNKKERERYYANYSEQRAKKNAYNAHYRKVNKGRINAKTSKRRADRIQRTPKWADLKAISKFYENCPPGMVVDHIVPLRGKNVSGLHVLENLQYLYEKDNQLKSNKFKV